MKIGLSTSEPSGDDNTCASIDVELRTLRMTLKVGVPNERYTVSVMAIPRGNAFHPLRKAAMEQMSKEKRVASQRAHFLEQENTLLLQNCRGNEPKNSPVKLQMFVSLLNFVGERWSMVTLVRTCRASMLNVKCLEFFCVRQMSLLGSRLDLAFTTHLQRKFLDQQSLQSSARGNVLSHTAQT